jgi:hypothetical protein
MTMFVSRRRSVAGAAVLVVFGSLLAMKAPAAATRAGTPQSEASPLPDHLSDAEFWRLVTDFSEPGGFFRITDNFTSNEPEIGRIFTMLREREIAGGVYLGVGPEQNLTYIAAIRPSMAFVVDIRRQAMMQHLLFKAMFELAADRADFISMLFARQRPPDLDEDTPIQQMWSAFADMPTDRDLVPTIAARITEQLTRTHGFAFTAEESDQMNSVRRAFVLYGPNISTRGWGGNGRPGGRMRNGGFADLTGWAYDGAGVPQSFLSTEANFQFVKSMHEKNLLVPLSGDFSGPKTIRAIAAYLRQHDAVVSAFYVSNVEQYLFQDGKAHAFYENVAALPMNDQSVFIRPYSMRLESWAATPLCPIPGFLREEYGGRIVTNNDALMCIR